MSTAFRSAFRAGASAARAHVRQQTRKMSGHGSPEEIFQHKEMWLKTSVGMVFGICIPYTIFTVYKELTHEHKPYIQYQHMKVRHKAFPWAASDCDFLDMACHKAFREGKPYDRSHGHGDHEAHH